jgi:hypothetical protein
MTCTSRRSGPKYRTGPVLPGLRLPVGRGKIKNKLVHNFHHIHTLSAADVGLILAHPHLCPHRKSYFKFCPHMYFAGLSYLSCSSFGSVPVFCVDLPAPNRRFGSAPNRRFGISQSYPHPSSASNLELLSTFRTMLSRKPNGVECGLEARIKTIIGSIRMPNCMKCGKA